MGQQRRVTTGPRLGLLTLYTSDIAAVGRISACNKRSYCALHGYDLLVEQDSLDPNRPPVWSKILAILKYLPNYNWLFWSDPDSLIMALEKRLESLCDDGFDLLVTRDQNGLNAGQMLIRNTPASQEFFKRVYEQRQFIGHLLQEQAAMVDLLEREPGILKIKYCPQRAFNSYPANYQPGDFVLHFAGTYNKLAGLQAFQSRTSVCIQDRRGFWQLFARLGLAGPGLVVGKHGQDGPPDLLGDWPSPRPCLAYSGPEGSAGFADGQFDWVYLDLPRVMPEELPRWYPKLRDGGIMAGRGSADAATFSAIQEFAQANDLTVYLAADPPSHSWHFVKGPAPAAKLGGALVRAVGPVTLDVPSRLRNAAERHKAGQLAEADAAYRQILLAEPDNADVIYRLAWLTRQQGYYQEAIDLMNRAVGLRPSAAEWHNDLGAILFSHGFLAEAAAQFHETARLRPDHPTALTNLAVVLDKQGKLDQAIATYQAAFQRRPPSARLLNDLAILLTKSCRFEEAIGVCRQALAMEPSSAESQNNLAVAFLELRRFDEASAAFDRACQLRPDDPDVRANRGMSLLLNGDLIRGWPEYAYRWKGIDRDTDLAKTGRPHWTGGDVHGKTVILYEHDGFGDVMQFVRYVPLVAELGAKVILKCPARLRTLLSSVKGMSQVVGIGEALPPFDLYAPLIEMPIVFKTSAETVPNQIPFIHADADLVERWRKRLEGLAGLKIGIAWQADPSHTSAVRRSAPLAAFEPLSRLDGVTLISLQCGPGAEQMRTAGFPVVDLGPEVDTAAGAFMDTAAIMKSLGLVVTVDTSIAHLAGAMGVETWVMLPFVSEWRWMRERADSPWYPAMRLYRQTRYGDWQGAFEQVISDVRGRLG